MICVYIYILSWVTLQFRLKGIPSQKHEQNICPLLMRRGRVQHREIHTNICINITTPIKTSIHSLASKYEIIQSNSFETMPIHDNHCWTGYEFQVFVQV